MGGKWTTVCFSSKKETKNVKDAKELSNIQISLCAIALGTRAIPISMHSRFTIAFARYQKIDILDFLISNDLIPLP